MIASSFGSAAPNSLSAFEKLIGWGLPKEYREFLGKWNGGRVVPNGRYVTDLKHEVIIDVLFGLETKPELNLEEWHRMYRDEVPKDVVIVGGDPFGNLFLLSLLDKVYFWDQMRKFRSSSENANAYLVCEGFERFLKNTLTGEGRHSPDIMGPRGPKLIENIWHDAGGGKLQEISRKTYIEFSRHEGFGFFQKAATNH